VDLIVKDEVIVLEGPNILYAADHSMKQFSDQVAGHVTTLAFHPMGNFW